MGLPKLWSTCPLLRLRSFTAGELLTYDLFNSCLRRLPSLPMRARLAWRNRAAVHAD